MVASFADKETETVFGGRASPKLPQDIQRRALAKLLILHNAVTTSDLRQSPGNMFERLKGDMAGFCSIRVNEQWRIVFKLKEATLTPPMEISEVQIIDYH